MQDTYRDIKRKGKSRQQTMENKEYSLILKSTSYLRVPRNPGPSKTPYPTGAISAVNEMPSGCYKERLINSGSTFSHPGGPVSQGREQDFKAYVPKNTTQLL